MDDPASPSAVGIAAVGVTAITVASVGVDARKSTSRLSKSDRKIGHWRVDNEGQVTYKKVGACHMFSYSVDIFTPFW